MIATLLLSVLAALRPHRAPALSPTRVAAIGWHVDAALRSRAAEWAAAERGVVR